MQHRCKDVAAPAKQAGVYASDYSFSFDELL